MGKIRSKNVERKCNLPPLQFADEINARQPSWRRIVALCAATGIACPSFSGSLGYLDQYRRARLPANLTQVRCSRGMSEGLHQLRALCIVHFQFQLNHTPLSPSHASLLSTPLYVPGPA
jgi:6-phosphogluconate dehydrogenase